MYIDFSEVQYMCHIAHAGFKMLFCMQAPDPQ